VHVDGGVDGSFGQSASLFLLRHNFTKQIIILNNPVRSYLYACSGTLTGLGNAACLLRFQDLITTIPSITRSLASRFSFFTIHACLNRWKECRVGVGCCRISGRCYYVCYCHCYSSCYFCCYFSCCSYLAVVSSFFGMNCYLGND
jgi:hypothetical protein